MPKLFIFAIGGTGSRVLKSLAMLLAAGVKPANNQDFEIVPIIIDPHITNLDLQRTKTLLENYKSIVDTVGLGNGFFNTKIEPLNNNYVFTLQEVKNQKFRQYINFDTLDPNNKALAEILFSGKSINKRHQEVNLLDVEMDIGFVGNPNIGSVVLNQFKDSQEFQDFANAFNEQDRIFIISSIFGGTGAAGFPIILKNIRNALNIQNANARGFLQNAKIGALTVCPYFNIQANERSPIQRSHFIAKTRAALYYYKDNITGNNSVNALYYIGDDYIGEAYPNDPGDGGQKNKAHFIELASALAIIDFLEIPDERLQCVNGKAQAPIYNQFAVKNDVQEITFADLYDRTKGKIEQRLSQLTFLYRYVTENLRQAIGQQAWCQDEPQINQTFLNTPFYRTYLSDFLKAYEEWLTELSENRRAFSPFNLNGNLETLIKGRQVQRGIFGGRVDYNRFDNYLNTASRGQQYPSAEKKFVKLFFDATNSLLTERFGFQQQ